MDNKSELNIYKTLKTILNLPFVFGFVIIFLLIKSEQNVVKDINVWKSHKRINNFNSIKACIFLLINYLDYRNLFYYRIKRFLKYSNSNFIVKAIIFLFYMPLSLIYRGYNTLIISGDIKGGLLLIHAFSTIVSAKSIGENCRIWHDVTIGFDDKGESPQIGDNVNISSGAKLIGGIKIGNNVQIGLNSLIVRSIPDNSVVVSQPSYIVKKNGKWVIEKLNNI